MLQHSKCNSLFWGGGNLTTTLITLHLHTCKWKEKQLLTTFKYIHLSSLPTECAQQSTPTSLPPVLEATDVCACHTDKPLKLLPLYGCQAAPPGSTIWWSRIPAAWSPLKHGVKDMRRDVYTCIKTQLHTHTHTHPLVDGGKYWRKTLPWANLTCRVHFSYTQSQHNNYSHTNTVDTRFSSQSRCFQ